MRLEQSLVLNRYFHRLFGARGLQDLKQPLNVQEGPAGNGQTYFYGALLGRIEDKRLREKLHEYDSRILGYESRLAKARGRFSFKYFQYLCLLYTEIFLDRTTENPSAFLRELNGFLKLLRKEEVSLSNFPDFEEEDLRRLAFFMATGSGKTLLLHVNFWQVLYYLEKGDCLVDLAFSFNNPIDSLPVFSLLNCHKIWIVKLDGASGTEVIDSKTGEVFC